MDNLKEKAEQIVAKLRSDEKLMEKFQKNPASVLEEYLGVDLPDDQVKALLQSKTPLADIHARWDRYADNRLDDVRDCIHDHAVEAIQRQHALRSRDAR